MSPRLVYAAAFVVWIGVGCLMAFDARRFSSIEPGMAASDMAARLDDLLARTMDEYSVTGAAAGAVMDGDVIWSARRGQRSSEGAPVTGATAFNLGSVSKPLAAWTVLTLAETGAVDLDAPVSDYLLRWQLPESAFDPSGVTLRRLLRHTAGLNIHGYGGYEADEAAPEDAAALSETGYPVRQVIAPGVRRVYSGGGYTLLQLAIEDVTGLPFDHYARTAVFGPLDMASTGFTPQGLPEVSDAFDYYGRSIDPLHQVALAATGAYASGDDLERFLLAHFDGGGVLSAASLEQLLEPAPENGRYAMSYTREMTPAGALYGHGGNNSTWHAQIYVRPQTGDGFYFVTNSTSGAQLGLELTCAWRSWALEDSASDLCAAERKLVHTLTFASIATAGLALVIAAWLLDGLIRRRRRLSLRPRGRGPLRLTGRLFGFALACVLFLGCGVMFYTNVIYWRSGVTFIDEIPLDEFEMLMPAILAALGGSALALWSSPVRRSA